MQKNRITTPVLPDYLHKYLSRHGTRRGDVARQAGEDLATYASLYAGAIKPLHEWISPSDFITICEALKARVNFPHPEVARFCDFDLIRIVKEHTTYEALLKKIENLSALQATVLIDLARQWWEGLEGVTDLDAYTRETLGWRLSPATNRSALPVNGDRNEG